MEVSNNSSKYCALSDDFWEFALIEKKINRILLKLSGEALLGKKPFGVDPKMLIYLASEIKSVVDVGTQVGIVIGGGNIFRGEGLAQSGIDRVTGDQMGMLATIINALALQDALERQKVIARVMSALSITQLAEPYIRRRAQRHLEKNRIVIFGGGTGNPYFTTDTAAVLRGIEIDADIIIKATKVDGIYSEDPILNNKATKYEKISFNEVIEKGLKVMDMTAFTLCKENNLPIAVLNIKDEKSLLNFIDKQNVGTIVS